MKFKFFCPRWGSENISWDLFCQRVKNEGYDGVEYGIPNEVEIRELDEAWQSFEKHGLDVIPQHYGTYDADFSRHFDNYAGWLEMVRPYPALKIDSQTGKDYFSFERNKRLIELAAEHTRLSGVAVFHETHRNKFTFAAHITFEYLSRLPDLRITLDASHWVNVAESFLEDQQEAMDLAILRTEHIHARVGYPEGPQVPDPAAPEWNEALQFHLNWWDKVVERKRLEGETLVTITPEFGPYPYMVHLPYSQKPVSDQWANNVYMMNLLKERYQKSY
ncbi:sugar phosphate isomerase/epimerase [Paradesertivirga mongoliensis]|uniref:Sugar phosphate isomerase/epimerase n=1 Tax=Paradesertivirga mongoliensis TaxID=2100740 RepID=A0ABW4ZQ53_9SPHI|nr:sugar phosphate isomerase/epimerase [Pedobacter mongoliensis]